MPVILVRGCLYLKLTCCKRISDLTYRYRATTAKRITTDIITGTSGIDKSNSGIFRYHEDSIDNKEAPPAKTAANASRPLTSSSLSLSGMIETNWI